MLNPKSGLKEMLGAQAPRTLDNHRAFASGNLDAFRDYLSGAYCDHRVYRNGSHASVAACHNRVQLRSMSLNYLTYGAEVEIDPGAFTSFYMLEIPLSGRTQLKYCGNYIENTPVSAVLISPDERVESVWSEDCGQQMVKISRRSVEQYAAQILGHALKAPLIFEPFLDLRTDLGRDISRFCEFLFSSYEQNSSVFGGHHVAGDLERALVSTLLMGQPSNYSDDFHASSSSVTPRHVKKALTYIELHLREDISMNVLADIASTSTRALYSGFERFVGMPPQTYIRNRRLEGARSDLEKMSAPVTVARIAMDWGFGHLGRFSIEYRARFGESPSDTLRR
jgi:AraC-like DNA-binding protein